MADDQKLTVIRKLLAKAEGAATTEEAEAYNAKAAAMMARHGVDAALLAATGQREDRIVEKRIALSDPYSREKAGLATSVGRALNCRLVWHRGYGRSQIAAVTMVGFESDIGRSEVLYTSLLMQATRQVLSQRPPFGSRESVAAYRRSWLAGFAAEVHKRLMSAEAAASSNHDAELTRSGPSAALVLADRRTRVEHEYDQRFGTLQKARRRTLSGTGFTDGVSAGRRADIGGRRISGSRGQIER